MDQPSNNRPPARNRLGTGILALIIIGAVIVAIYAIAGNRGPSEDNTQLSSDAGPPILGVLVA